MAEIRTVSPIELAIFQLLSETAEGKSIDPMNVAKAVDPENWRHRLGHVRTEAVRLAQIGELTILRHNKPADPGRFRGVYRLRAPMPGDSDALAALAAKRAMDDEEDLD